MGLTREQIVAINDVMITEIDVPEWGGSVYIKPLSVEQRDAFTDLVMNAEGKIDSKGFQVKMLLFALVNEQGNRIFTNEDEEFLNKKSTKVIDFLFKKVQQLSGMGDNAITEAKDSLKKVK